MALRSIVRTLLVTLFAWSLLPVAAQTGDTKPAKVEVFTGYSWMNAGSTVNGFEDGAPSTLHLKDARGGFLVDISYFFNNWLGLTADTGAHFGNQYDADEIFFGPTVRFPGEHIQPFIHVLGGWSRLAPQNNEQHDAFGVAVGGGFDFKVTRHLNFRLLQADYRYGNHNFPLGPGRPDSQIRGARLATGIVFLAGIGEELPVSATCAVTPAEVFAGEPVKASVTTQNFNPKHTLKYDWVTNGGKVQGQGDTVTIDTTGVAEGQSYSANVHVSDPSNKKALANCQATFATKKWLPPTISCTARPTSLLAKDGPVTIHCDASSPQGGNVTVSHQGNNISGQGTDLTVATSGLGPGEVTVQSTVTDSRQLTASTSTPFTVLSPPPTPTPTPTPTPPAELELRSVYFVTAQPTAKNPDRGFAKSQEQTLVDIASRFEKYVSLVPSATLILQGYADERGGDAYNQALTDRRVALTRKVLVERGVAPGKITTESFGKAHPLTSKEVEESMQDYASLTPGEQKRIKKNSNVIRWAANRRVDIKLDVPGLPSRLGQRKYPFNAEDALTLIGGREKPKVVKPRPRGKKGGAKPGTRGGKKAPK